MKLWGDACIEIRKWSKYWPACPTLYLAFSFVSCDQMYATYEIYICRSLLNIQTDRLNLSYSLSRVYLFESFRLIYNFYLLKKSMTLLKFFYFFGINAKRKKRCYLDFRIYNFDEIEFKVICTYFNWLIILIIWLIKLSKTIFFGNVWGSVF